VPQIGDAAAALWAMIVVALMLSRARAPPFWNVGSVSEPANCTADAEPRPQPSIVTRVPCEPRVGDTLVMFVPTHCAEDESRRKRERIHTTPQRSLKGEVVECVCV
jgi:hypothetical protein